MKFFFKKIINRQIKRPQLHSFFVWNMLLIEIFDIDLCILCYFLKKIALERSSVILRRIEQLDQWALIENQKIIINSLTVFLLMKIKIKFVSKTSIKN
ncbi:hypothetical protein BpHYR1_020349 [Brachionus plicatilis]|uniref:Uncharacterized protein n=1 Tax=Brachionus plicatilis TaxID=10195 RepID=A0A3M7QHQ1_BRAPC|nr:hypothetical protein BpHYR1_020349 [Brachionus plicatilis]